MIYTSGSANSDMQPYTHDPEYYWEFLTFSIGNHLFRVPKSRFLEDSETFCKEYGIVSAPGAEGGEQVRIPLDVDIADFQSFLKALYPRAQDGGIHLPADGWISVLKLSTQWLFNDLRKIAIRRLSEAKDLDAIDRTYLGKRYSISSMLVSSYAEIIEKCNYISVEEAARMDTEKETAIHLYQVMVRRLRGLSKTTTVEEDIETVFSAELDNIRQTEQLYLTAKEKAKVAEERAKCEEAEKAIKSQERTLPRKQVQRLALEPHKAIEAPPPSPTSSDEDGFKYSSHQEERWISRVSRQRPK